MEFEVKSPILGFEQIKKMKLEKVAQDDETFMQLKSLHDDGISFTLINPYSVRSDYEFEIPLPIKEALVLKDSTNVAAQSNQVVTLNIVCIQEPIQNSTINFLAPILFNFENQTLAQVVLENQKYENFGLAEPISKFFDFMQQSK
ncbi:flagellar assembly protein FliW [uncultured Helicobacter sp.]|mgnify:CR=1 FL=1|uniref:flagellar assembly protein FliW n=1 Tax=uncultured Helicobacter sp. TaxID=175537 RepID=UPI002622CB2A|nr:flagellar assembly protein FliW [uncultured Helicobacter sp.]